VGAALDLQIDRWEGDLAERGGADDVGRIEDFAHRSLPVSLIVQLTHGRVGASRVSTGAMHAPQPARTGERLSPKGLVGGETVDQVFRRAVAARGAHEALVDPPN